MAPSGDTKLGPSSGDFLTIHTKHNVHLPTGTKSYGLGSLSFNFRRLCVVGTVFVIVMGLLSRSYLESPLQILKKQSFDRAARMQSKYNSIIEKTASDLSLKLLEDNSAQSSAPNGRTSQESAREGLSSTQQQGSDPEITVDKAKEFGSQLPAEDFVGTDGKQVKDMHNVSRTVESEEQDHIQQGEEKPFSVNDGQHANERLSKTMVEEQVQIQPRVEESSTQKQQEQVELLLTDQQQDGNLRMSGEAKERVEAKEAQDRALVDTSSVQRKSNLTSSTGACDMTVGKWVHNPAGPLYRFDQCRVLSGAQNCKLNGRPDNGYEFYNWEPEHCSLPRFDAHAFLELMQGKTLAFVGDSLARNQMESLMCILLQVAEAQSKGSKDIHKWYFPSHKFTLIRMWSSWLVQTNGYFPPSLAPPGVSKLNLTELDDYAENLPKFDVTVLSSGHWWLRKTAYFMNGEMLGGTGWEWPHSSGDKKMNYTMAFEIALNTALEKLGSCPGYKGLTILRTYTPDHYSGGSWDTGGSCTGETKPYDKAPKNTFNEMMRSKQLKAFKSRGGTLSNGSKLRLLDVYPILNYRGDGHPGPYRNTDPLKKTARDSNGRPPPQDCLHWCMPGPVDTMNELLFDLLRKEMQ